jgi:hypothetical protein
MLRPRYGACPAAWCSEGSYGSLAWRCAAPIALNQAHRGREAAVLAPCPRTSTFAVGNTMSWTSTEWGRMMPYPFNPGDRVLFNPTAGPDDLGFFSLMTACDDTAGEVWEVVRRLQPLKGMYQYRIKARQDGRKRIATASQLRPALWAVEPGLRG